MGNAVPVTAFTAYGAPVAAGAAENDFIGSTATLNVSFANGDAAQPGYAPFIDLVLPAGHDGVAFQDATYLGQPVKSQSVVFDAHGHANSPVAKDANGQPVVIDGAPGATLVTLTLPFGSFTPGQTPVDVAVHLGVSDNALVGLPLDVTATGGFAYGNSATGVTAANPPIFGAQTDYNVVPQIVTLRTQYIGPEQETATGPSYPHLWDSVATIAPGQTITNLVLTQTLPDGAVFLPGSSTLLDGSGTAAGTVTYDAATRTVTGVFTSPETGAPGNTPTLQAGFYVMQDYADPADGTAILDPATGAFAPLTDSSTLTADWHSTNPLNPTSLAAGPTPDTITAKSIAIQKGVADLTHGAAAYQPGDTLQYSLAGQVSNYFDVDDLVITDTLGDGQTFQAGVTPVITIADEGTTLYSGTVAANEFTVAPKAADGTTTITFDVSNILTDNGQAGDLNGGTAANPNPATAAVVFDTTIDQNYAEAPAPSVSRLVDQGDSIGNGVVFSGKVASTGDAIADGSAAGIRLPTNVVSKSVYAVNGVRVSGPVTIQAGDLVTYDVQLYTPLTSTQDVKLTDYLPLPIFTAGSVTNFDTTQGAGMPAVGTAEFGPANTYSPVVGQPVTITTNATSNSVTFDLGSYTDQPVPAYPAETADILFTVRAGDQAFADGLLLTNQVHATETNSFGATTASNAIVQIRLGEPELRIQKAVEGSSDPNAVLTGSAGPAGLVNDATLAASPLGDSLAGIVAGDSVSFTVVVQNTGSGPNGAFNVVLHDTVPTGFDAPTHVRVTDGAGNALAYTDVGGGLFDPNGGIMLTDPGAMQGALAADSATSGANIAVITYDAVAAATVPVPGYDLHNVATVTHYAAQENGGNRVAVTPAGDLVASSDVYTALPTLAKAVISTSAVAPNASGANNIHDLAIGEEATYDITLTLTKGTANDVTVSDLLPNSGNGELAFVSAQVKSIGGDISGSALAVGDSSSSGVFHFGALTDGSNAQGAADQVVIEVTALAVDDGNNRGGEQVTNSAVLSETDPNHPNGAPYTQTATATETLVEPSLHLGKTSDVSTVQAGDTVTYTLLYTNTGSAAAYDTVITDPLDRLGVDAVFNEGSVAIANSTAIGAAIVTGDGAGDSSVAVDVAEIDPGQTVSVTYTASVLPGAVTGTNFPNTASVTASTLPGHDPLARTEATSGSDTVYVQTPAIAKALIAGSDANIAVPGLTAGETGMFELTVSVPHGSAPGFDVMDTLPGGMTYVPGSATVVSVGGNLQVTRQVVSESGQVLTVDFGDVTDTGTGADTAADQVVIDYQAVVDATAANGAGAVDTNVATVSSNGAVLGTASNTPVIVAPQLTLAKTADLHGAPAVAGTDVTYTLTIGQVGMGPAYNVHLGDLLPADETYDPGSVRASTGTATYANGSIDFTDPALLVGAGPVTITYSATLDLSVTPGEQVTNTASVAYDSQPTGGYAETPVSASATVPVVLTPTIDKSILSLSNPFSTADVVTGETVTYKLLTTVQPGTQDLQVWDYPFNLTITGATLASVGSGLSGSGLTLGPVVAGSYFGFTTYEFGTVVATPDTGSADQIELDVTGTVNLVPGGTPIDNDGFAITTDPGSGANFTYGVSYAPTLTDVKSSLSGTVFTDGNDDGVLNNADGGLAGVTVQLLDGSGTPTGATTTTDSAGHYSFGGLELGSYSVQVVAPGADGFSPVGTDADPAVDSIVDGTGVTAPVTLQPGADTPNQNAGVYAPVSVSGTVFNDANADGSQQARDAGYGGDAVQLLDGAGHPIAGATTTTDAHGDYSFTGLKPGTYAVQVTDPAGDTFSLPGSSTTAPNSIVNQAGVTAPVTLTSGQAATAQDAGVYGPGSLSGTVFTDGNDDGVIDGADAPVAGVTVTLLDGTGTPTGAVTTTDAHGHYSFGGLHPANYAVQVVAPAGDAFSVVGTDANPAVDSIVGSTGASSPVAVTSNTDTPNQNAGVYVPVSIAGVVFTDQNADGVQQPGDTGVAGHTVSLLSGTTVVATTTTGAGGAYSFTGLAPGSYTVAVTDPAGNVFSPPASGNPPVDSVVGSTGATPPITLMSGQSAPYENAGVFVPASLSGRAFFDTNADGQQEGGEATLSGVTVTLLDGNGNPVGTATTAADGTYGFTGLTPGQYSVQFTAPNGDRISPVGSGPAAADSVVDGSGRTPVVTLASGSVAANQNSGFYSTGSLSGTVFTDNNDNGVADGSDAGLGGVMVKLLDGTGTATGATATTDAGGHYSFGNLLPGSYSVQVVAPAGDGFSPVGTNANPALDSIVGGTGRTSPVTVAAGADTPNQNAGVYVPVSVSGVVFTDANADGSQQAGDSGVAGDTVALLDGSGAVVGTATTAADGSYSFTGLMPGAYGVQVSGPAGDSFSPKGSSATLPNSVVGSTGATAPTVLTSGQSLPNQDAGVYAPASLSGHAFFDSNGDGQQNGTETRLPGVTVTLLDAGGHPTGATTTTDAQGNYGFSGLVPGRYSVQFTTPNGDLVSPVGSGPAGVDSIVGSNGATPPVTLGSGVAATNQNAGFYQVGGLSGVVFTDGNADGVIDGADAGLGGVGVRLIGPNGQPTGASTTTAADGSYSFGGLIPGQYSVQVVAPAGDAFSPVGSNPNPALDSIVGSLGATAAVAVAGNQVTANQNAGVYGPASLSGTVFTDGNANGTQEAGDKGYGGDTIQLLDGSGHAIPGATTVTAADGTYSFTGLKPGTYAVQVTDPAGDRFSPPGSSATLPNSIVNGAGMTAPVTLGSGQAATGQNAGVYAPGGISGNVFADQNGDGSKQAGEPNQAGDTVNLLDGNGYVVASTTTDANGNYSFGNLTPGGYGVQVVAPAGNSFSPPGTSGTLENSVVDGSGRTPPIVLGSGQQVTGENAGDYKAASIGGTAFLDAHCDGVDDYGDPAFKGVTVRLYDGAGGFTGRTAVTDANGRYSFGALQPGAYQVQFVDLVGTAPSYYRVGSNNAANSDQKDAQGFSEVFTVTGGQVDGTHGLGLHLTGRYANSPTTTLDATHTAAAGGWAGITVIGGSGPEADIIAGGVGNNILVGGNGSNVIESGYGTNLVLGGCGPYAQIQGLGTNDFLFGGKGDDLIQGQGGNEFIAAGVGNQTIFGGGGHNSFIANANGGTITDTAGAFSDIKVGDLFVTEGNTDVVYNAGDGVIFIADYNPAAGDTLTVNGYAAPTAVGNANGYNILYFGPNAAVLLAENTGRLAAGSPVPAGVTFNAAAPTAAPLTVAIDANGFLTLTPAGAAHPAIGPTPGPVISGAVSGQATTGEGPVTPFFGVTIGDTAPGQTETVTVAPFSPGYGSFATLGGGSVANGVYTITGAPAVVTAAVDALQWVPALSGIGVGQSVGEPFRITATDTAGLSATNSTASLTATRAAAPPSISGAVAGRAVADTGSVSPFAGLRVGDPNGELTETATVTLSSTANGALGNTGGGHYDVAGGVFSVSGSAQYVSAVLDGLSFTPVAHEAAAGSTVATGFTVAVMDSLGGTAVDATTSVVARQSAAPVAPAAASVTLAEGQSYTGGNGTVSVAGNPNGNNGVTLGDGDDTVRLAGFGNSVHVGTGTDTVDAGYGAAITAAGGNQTITLEGYGSAVTLTGSAVASVTGGYGNSSVTLHGGTGVVGLAGYNNVVTVAGGTNTIDAGYGAQVTAIGGSDTISLEGFNSSVFIGGGAQATIAGGMGNSQITTASGAVTIGLAGYGNVVATGAASDTITDSALGNSRFDVGGGASPGLDILHSFAADANSVVNVVGAAAAGYTSASLFNGLTANASGFAQLALPDNGGTVVFAGLTAGQLHASNFRAG